MTTILQKVLSEIESEDDTEKIRKLCYQINEEEKSNIKNDGYLPVGPNIFLSLEVPGRNDKELAFLALERESADLYLSVLYTIAKTQLRKPDWSLKRQRVWEIEDHRPEKILTNYAKTYKYLRGE